MNILFVDKEKNVCETLYPLIARKNNAEYRIVDSAQKAISTLREGFIPDFLFMDYDSPPGNGMDVILYMQTREYGEKVKVFMTTSLGDYKKIENLADMLKVYFERKPLQLFSLQKFINEHLPKQA